MRDCTIGLLFGVGFGATLWMFDKVSDLAEKKKKQEKKMEDTMEFLDGTIYRSHVCRIMNARSFIHLVDEEGKEFANKIILECEDEIKKMGLWDFYVEHDKCIIEAYEEA